MTGLHGGRVVVVGGGIVGTSIAYHLGARGYRDVLVLERGRIGEGATAYATGGIRRQFSSRVNVELVQRSIGFWEQFETRTGSPLDFRRHGYLFLLDSPEAAARMAGAVAMQRSLGVHSEILGPDDVAAVFPGVRTDDLAGATFTPDDGSAAPSDAVAGFARAARRAGVEIREHTEFHGLELDPDGAVRGVRTDGGPVAAELVVLAAGPQSRAVGAGCGVDLPVSPHPRQAFATAAMPPLARDLPLAVDLASGAYVHPEPGGTAIVGGSDRDTPPGERSGVDWDRVEALGAALAHRFPFLAAMRVRRGWVGLREMTPDDHALVGPIADVPGLWVAAGFSGHGFMQAPAVGAELTRWWLDGAPEPDLSALAPDRFAGAARTPERATETAVF